VRRMLCEATVITMLEKGREPLALGRRRRLATRGQRRALLRRDGGCARPGCPENRRERLHAHHMRHWLFGGRTDLANLVLLCDVDHGLVHDHDLVLSRHEGRLIVLTPDGRHIWGTADVAFTTGLTGTPDPFVGVHPIDTAIGRRPTDAPPDPQAEAGPGNERLLRRRPRRRRTAAPATPRARARRPPDGHSRRRTGAVDTTPARGAARLSRVLFPDGEPVLPDTLQEHYDRMDLRYAVGVLMGNRDVARRMAAEAGVSLYG
jgi:hypothetical protein